MTTQTIKEKIEKEFEEILREEGLLDWKIKIIQSGGGLCEREKKEIWLDEKNFNLPFFLHEVAHALTPEERFHGAIWGDRFTALIRKYWEKSIESILKEKAEEIGKLKALHRHTFGKADDYNPEKDADCLICDCNWKLEVAQDILMKGR